MRKEETEHKIEQQEMIIQQQSDIIDGLYLELAKYMTVADISKLPVVQDMMTVVKLRNGG